MNKGIRGILIDVLCPFPRVLVLAHCAEGPAAPVDALSPSGQGPGSFAAAQ